MKGLDLLQSDVNYVPSLHPLVPGCGSLEMADMHIITNQWFPAEVPEPLALSSPLWH